MDVVVVVAVDGGSDGGNIQRVQRCLAMGAAV